MALDYTIFYIGFGALVGIMLILWKIGIFKKKPDHAQVVRAPTEKSRRIFQLKYNGKYVHHVIADGDGKILYEQNNKYEKLFKGRELLGKIKSITPHGKIGERFLEIVFTPAWKKWRNIGLYFFSQPDIILLGENILSFNSDKKYITIETDVGISGVSAWHYDHANQRMELNMIVDEIHKTDWENLGDRYFAESQKSSAIPTSFGRDLAIEELKLQQEKEKRAKLVSG